MNIKLRNPPRGEGKNVYCVFSDGEGMLFSADNDEDLIEKVCKYTGWSDDEFGYTLLGSETEVSKLSNA